MDTTVDVQDAELVVRGKDGSTRIWRWIGEVHTVEFVMEKTSGFPKAEMGNVHFMFSHWPAASVFDPHSALSPPQDTLEYWSRRYVLALAWDDEHPEDPHSGDEIDYCKDEMKRHLNG